MKYIGVDYGRIIEGFEILPNIGISWMTLEKRYYDVMFKWLYWYITIGQIKKKLKENGY